MKTATLKIDLYQFNELNKEAQAFAIDKHINFLSMENESRNEEEAEPLTEDYAKESILINEYYFYEDGELANVTKFTGKHPLSGSEVYEHKGQRIFLQNPPKEKVLTVTLGTYGSSESPVFYIKDSQVNTTQYLFQRDTTALQLFGYIEPYTDAGYKIVFGDQKQK
jgi:hypothetical protein